ncbi:olfactory receptor 1G1-like [Ambystoma mexicanum]|uniref:olfactory receptor 1G1-like n=1 Tax=Ambystoma mexicanum TaxID=8296 RepID=UPI0037E74615
MYIGVVNQTAVERFILLGLSDDHRQQTALFVLFLAMYVVAIGGNALIVSLIVVDSQLYTPMYFFLANLSSLDICLTTVILPNMLSNLITEDKSISFGGCITQFFFFAFLTTAEVSILAVMAIDRYVAICNPLRYTTVMNKRVCVALAAVCWIYSCLHSLVHSLVIASLSYCGPNEIQQFFCDMPPLLKLSCSETTTSELMTLTGTFLLGVVTITSVVVSYIRIIYTILMMKSRESRRKAFFTCSSHLMVVTLYYGTIVFVYLRPKSSYSLEKDKGITVMYTVVSPMVNPFIYSLRNNRVKDAVKRMTQAFSGSVPVQQYKDENKSEHTESETRNIKQKKNKKQVI